MKYRSEPVEVEAVRITDAHSYLDAINWLGPVLKRSTIQPMLRIKIQFIGHATIYVNEGDWIIKDGDTFSVRSDEEFKRKYEACE